MKFARGSKGVDTSLKSFKLPNDLISRLNSYAVKQHGRTYTSIVIEAVDIYLKARESISEVCVQSVPSITKPYDPDCDDDGVPYMTEEEAAREWS